MVTVQFDPTFDDGRRRRLFAGDAVVYTDVPAVATFADFTRSLINEHFAPEDALTMHRSGSPEQLADTLIDFKPRFIHDPGSKEHVRRITTELGATPDTHHADVPRLRTAFPRGGLDTGIACAFQAHRDTWYWAPPQQINWWMPVWPVAAENIMEFYPRWFGTGAGKQQLRLHLLRDQRVAEPHQGLQRRCDVRVHLAPLRELPADEPRLCLVPPVGGITLFSGDHLRVDPQHHRGHALQRRFRTVNVADVRERRGAPLPDAACGGTTLRDFRWLTDGVQLSEDDIASYDTRGDAQGAEGITMFSPA